MEEFCHDTIYRFRLLNDDTYPMLTSTCQFAVCVISRSACEVSLNKDHSHRYYIILMCIKGSGYCL